MLASPFGLLCGGASFKGAPGGRRASCRAPKKSGVLRHGHGGFVVGAQLLQLGWNEAQNQADPAANGSAGTWNQKESPQLWINSCPGAKPFCEVETAASASVVFRPVIPVVRTVFVEGWATQTAWGGLPAEVAMVAYGARVMSNTALGACQGSEPLPYDDSSLAQAPRFAEATPCLLALFLWTQQLSTRRMPSKSP